MSRTEVSDNSIIVDAIEAGPTGASIIGNGTKTVTTLGTSVQLSSSSVPCKRVWIQSYESNGSLTNGGLVVVGGSAVVAAAATRNGYALYPTQGAWFEVSDLNLLWIDSVDNSAKISYHYEL